MKHILESVLSNGLRIITKEDDGADVLTASVWVRAGSLYEKTDEVGYAHLLEHVILAGSEAYKNRLDLAAATDAYGLYVGGNTRIENMEFVVSGGKQFSSEMISILANIVRKPLLTNEIIEAEKNIIFREIDKANDSLAKRIENNMLLNVFGQHEFSRNPLGSKESVQNASGESVRDFYKTYFVPNNACLILCGNITHQNAIILAEKYFGAWEAGDVSTFQRQNNYPAIANHVYAESNTETQETKIRVCYLIPRNITVKEYALLMCLKYYLTAYPNSILSKILRIEKQLIYSIGANTYLYSTAAMFYISTSSKNAKEVVDIIFNKIQNATISDEELSTVKVKTIGYSQMMFSNSVNPDFIGAWWVVFGHMVSEMDIYNEIQNITSNEMNSFIKKNLTSENRLLVTAGPSENISEPKQN